MSAEAHVSSPSRGLPKAEASGSTCESQGLGRAELEIRFDRDYIGIIKAVYRHYIGGFIGVIDR